MELTDRQLKLILLAVDSTAVTLHDSATATGSAETQSEADDMDKLYDKVLEEITFRDQTIKFYNDLD